MKSMSESMSKKLISLIFSSRILTFLTFDFQQQARFFHMKDTDAVIFSYPCHIFNDKTFHSLLTKLYSFPKKFRNPKLLFSYFYFKNEVPMMNSKRTVSIHRRSGKLMRLKAQRNGSTVSLQQAKPALTMVPCLQQAELPSTMFLWLQRAKPTTTK